MFNNFNKLLQLDATSYLVWIMRLKKSTRGIVWPVARMGSDSRRVMMILAAVVVIVVVAAL
jgi:hypothetical protein